ncbi:MAG TPA: general secretion pathway protein [Planctomycetaceae bacterium]|nr:general secretion pathway protein [Planctomycetaceae bacterium]
MPAKKSELGKFESPGELEFSFDRTPWRDVIRWLADNCDLALQYEELPTGSFTYSDRQVYSSSGAIDRINLFLLPQGFTLVRSGNLLSVINLGDPRSQLQLDTLAPLVPLEKLDELPDQTVVKCLFQLEELAPDDAVEELSVLNLIKTPAILSRTQQLLIVDTVGKLKSVKQILDAFKPTTLANGTAMKSYALEHVTAEDILTVARPHLGLATGENIGIDVSVSTDPKGENLFVTGVEDKLALFDNLVSSLDRPIESLTADGSAAVLKTHRVESDNLEAVYNVLQTLLAGKTLRLSMDEAANNIVALAPPSIQREIELTVEQMAGVEAEFEVIPLNSIQPIFAISLLEEMLDLPSEYDDVDPEDLAAAPKIDADPGNMRLFVRGQRHQIDQIKQILSGLDSPETISREKLRVLPMQGKTAMDLLRSAARFWDGGNPIVLLRSETDLGTKATERVVADEPSNSDSPFNRLVATPKQPATRVAAAKEKFLTEDFDPAKSAIRCQFNASGLVLQSEDTVALDDFEQHLRSLAGRSSPAPSPPIVFYLKFTKPAEAITMLAELLDGGESAKEGTAGTLVNGSVSSFSYLGSIVSSRDGTMTMSADSITVVADPRLNRLIAQGTSQDLQRIEEYLEIIDKKSSITDVEVYGRSHVVELKHTIASDIAEVLRGAYATRLADAKSSAQQPSAPPKESQPEDKRSSKSPAKAQKKTGAAAAADFEPKMTIAVHEASNSIIVTAPDPLFQEVRDLVDTLDQRSEQAMEVVAGGTAALGAVLGQSSSGNNSRSSRSSSRSSSGRSSSVSEFLRSRFGK